MWLNVYLYELYLKNKSKAILTILTNKLNTHIQMFIFEIETPRNKIINFTFFDCLFDIYMHELGFFEVVVVEKK
jgi:hypothetical protein